jgi:hypothetical protein
MSNYTGAIEILPHLWLGDTTVVSDPEYQIVILCDSSKITTDAKVYRFLFNSSHVDRICNEVADLIKENILTSNILVASQSGDKKAPTAIIAYLIKYGKMSPHDALLTMTSKRTDVGEGV